MFALLCKLLWLFALLISVCVCRYWMHRKLVMEQL